MNTIPRYASSAVQFSDSAYIDCGTGLSLGGGTPFTIEAWIYPTLVQGTTIIFRGTNQTNAEYFLVLGAGELEFFMGNQTIICNSISVVLNTWQQVAVTYDGTTLTIYVNGVQGAQQSWSTPPVMASASTIIGGTWTQLGEEPPFMSDNFQGMIARVAIWKECRDLDQIVSDSVQWEAHRLVSKTASPNDPELAIVSSNSNLLAMFDFTNIPAVEVSGNNVPFTFMKGAEYAVCIPGLSLNGTTDYADCGANPLLSFGGNAEYTIEGWFSAQNISSTLTPTIVSKLNAPSTAEYQVVIGTEQLWSYRNVAPYTLAAPPVLENNEFYHFASTYDGQTQSVYLNGNLQTTKLFGSQGTATNVSTLIGANFQNSAPGYFFKGKIQNVRIWSVALEQKAIRQWMYNDPDPTSNSLVASFDFTVDPPVDETNNNTLTLNGGATITTDFVAYTNQNQVQIGVTRPVVNEVLGGTPLDTVNDITVPDVPPPADQQPDLFTPTHFERLKEDLTNGYLKGKNEATKQAAYARLRTAFDKAADMVKKDPKLLDPFTTTRANGIVTLTHHTPAGDQVIFQAADDATPACVIWWISFIYTVTAGFFIALGLLPGGGAIAGKIYKLVSNSPKAMKMLEALLARGSGIGVVTATAVVKGLYDLGLVWPIMKFMFVSAGWWFLGRILVKVIAFITGVEAAELLVGFIIWAARLVILTTQYTGSCPVNQLAATA